MTRRSLGREKTLGEKEGDWEKVWETGRRCGERKRKNRSMNVLCSWVATSA